jgi:hypothetical protein
LAAKQVQKGTMRFLLDDELLSGAHDVATSLRPQRSVRYVDAGGGTVPVVQLMTYLCQVWGGQSHPILPVTDRKIPGAYLRCLQADQYDVIDHPDPQRPGLDLPGQIKQERAWDYPAILVAAHMRRELIRTVRVPELDPGDPWAPIYAATLGVLPLVLDGELQSRVMLSEELAFETIAPVEHVRVAAGGLEDLVSRLSDPQVLSPRQLASTALAYGLGPDTSFMGDPPLLPSPNHERRAAGPNIIVVVSADNAADLALLWNLRGAHGDQRALPIGVPVDQLTREALAILQRPGIATMFGWAGGPCRLTSVSVPPDELSRLAAGTPAVSVPYQELLTFGPAPGRPHTQIATFTAGAAYLQAMTESDRDILTVTRQAPIQPQLVLDATVADAPLPADLTLRGRSFGPTFQSGAAQLDVRQNSLASVSLRWPTPWTSLEAVARTRGLRVRPSGAGQAAATLISALGSVDAIGWLAHRPLIQVLYRLAERSGMSWQKEQLNKLRAQLTKQGRPTDTLDQAEAVLTTPEHVVTPAGEGRALGFQDFKKALLSDSATERWVTWAERHHLLVRGVDIVCPHCKAPSWLPMASVPPPVGCPGCGRSLEVPYRPQDLPFAYRIGEPLRRVLETDSLGHVFALHWFKQLFGDRSTLIGAYPGVDIDRREGKRTNRIGEADVLLLFSDGSLVPVEVKRAAAGFGAGAIRKMDRVAEALNAPYDVMAVSQPARECPALPAAIVQRDGRPRYLITDDQLLDRAPRWPLGTDPFAWNPRTENDDLDRAKAFKAQMEAFDPDQPWDLVRDTLLAES